MIAVPSTNVSGPSQATAQVKKKLKCGIKKKLKTELPKWTATKAAQEPAQAAPKRKHTGRRMMAKAACDPISLDREGVPPRTSSPMAAIEPDDPPPTVCAACASEFIGPHRHLDISSCPDCLTEVCVMCQVQTDLSCQFCLQERATNVAADAKLTKATHDEIC